MDLALWIKFASSCICISHLSCAKWLKHYQILADWKKWYFSHCFVAATEFWEEFLCKILSDGKGRWNWQMNHFCLRYLTIPRVCAKYRLPKTELTDKARHIASCMFCFRCCFYFHLCSLLTPDAQIRILQQRSIFPLALGLIRSHAGGAVGHQIPVVP
jgi:hypothetical protein